MALAVAVSSADDPLAFLIGYSGDVKVAGENPELGMAIFTGDNVAAGKDSNASILLKDDNLYKIGANSKVKVQTDLIAGDIKKLPKKDGTWAILYKKFQDRLKAQKDLSQYGAVRSEGFEPDMAYASKGEVRNIVDTKRQELELTKNTQEYFLIGGSIWEYYSYYKEAFNEYESGIRLFPTSKELTVARAIVKAKMQ
jgi:hypothetical protein